MKLVSIHWRAVSRIFISLTFMVLAAHCWAAYPAAWPDSGQGSINSGWIAYTQLGSTIRDASGSQDTSTGGSTPTQAADIVSSGGVLPSVYYSYDPVNQVLYSRIRLSASPLTSTPDGGSNDDPFSPTMWSMLIDADGDGYREFVVMLNGDSGGAGNPFDDINVFYANTNAQDIPVGSTPVYTVKSAIFPDSDARSTVADFGRTRVVSPTLTGGGWYLDWQIPLTAFTVNGTQLITPTTFFSFGFATANSNTNPLQKDVAYNGDFTAGVNTPFPFGDPTTPGGGIDQRPVISQLATSGCNPTLISATVIDTLNLVGGTITSSIAHVNFYYQPDSNNDGVPDTGSSPVLIGTATSPSPNNIALWQVNWANGMLPNGTYVITAVATDQQGNVSTPKQVGFTLTCGTTGLAITGTVYQDLNHNGQLDLTESGTGLTGLYAKLLPANTTTAIQAVPVDGSTGTYQFPSLPVGTFSVLIDNNVTLTDSTPYLPSGWLPTDTVNLTRSNIVVGTTSIYGVNFGLWHGSQLTGVVFVDTGIGGGIANDGIQNGGESAIPSVSIRVTDAIGGVIYDNTTTNLAGQYTLWIPYAAGSSTLKVTEANSGAYISTGGKAGNTGGSYDRSTDTVTFTNTPGTSYAGVNFGDVTVNRLTNDGQQITVAGNTVTYPHVFYPGSAGQVTFMLTQSSTPTSPAWSAILYQDINGDGVLDTHDTVITAPLMVTSAMQPIYLLVRVFVPENAPANAQSVVPVTANFTYTNATPPLTAILTRSDTTIVEANAGLRLTKTANRATAKSGDTIMYTITYQNITGGDLQNLVIHDATPVYTSFVSASYTTPFPQNLTQCIITTPPVGQSGVIQWSFAGTLTASSQGTVSYQVVMQ